MLQILVGFEGLRLVLGLHPFGRFWEVSHRGSFLHDLGLLI